VQAENYVCRLRGMWCARVQAENYVVKCQGDLADARIKEDEVGAGCHRVL